MLICADTPLPTLHTLAPGILFTCHSSKRSSARCAPVTPPQRPPKQFKRIPRRPIWARASSKSTQAAATQAPALGAATTSHESAPRTPRNAAGRPPQSPLAARPAGRATTPFRGTSEADGARTPKQTTAVTAGGAHGGGSMAGSPMRRNSPPAIPGPSGISPATPAQQLASPADEPAVTGRNGEAEDTISLGEVDEGTFWINPGETVDWHLSFLQQLHVLGRGSFGVVYLVRHRVTRELAALKCIEKHHNELAKEARRVEAERSAWQAVSHHPFVATLKAYFETTKAWCFVMEYVSRGTLSQIIRRSGPLPENRAKVVAAQLAHALNFVHEAGYLHRDISSSNVLLDERGNARLIDFGLCQLSLEARNRCGSLAYMAPEVLRREHYGVAADWWSYGIVLYTMLIGKTPLSQYAAEQNLNIQGTRRELRYSMALAAPLRFPRSLTDDAYNILQEILREDPSMRLGCRYGGSPGNGGGFQELMEHRFFANIDWRTIAGDVRQNPDTSFRNPREDASAYGTPAGRAVRQRNYLDIRSLCWCALDEPWQPQPTPRKPRRRKPASRSHQLGDLSVDKGLPNGPGTGSQRDLPTPLRLGCLYDVDAGAQGCGGVMPRVQIKTCTAAFRRLVTSARARDKTRRHPVPLEWCSPRPLPRLAMPRLAVPRLAVPVMTWLPDTSEWKRIFVINDIPV